MVPPRLRRLGDVQRALFVMAAATALLYVIATGIGVVAYLANHDRINDLQRSRVYSCETTYKAFGQVFRPFFRPPEQRTPKEKSDIAKFNKTVARLRHSCTKQTTRERTPS